MIWQKHSGSHPKSAISVTTFRQQKKNHWQAADDASTTMDKISSSGFC
jgi:hypothetical protein